MAIYTNDYSTNKYAIYGKLLPSDDVSEYTEENIERFKMLLSKHQEAGESMGPVVSTFSLAYTTNNAYVGGVLSPNGDVHFVPHYATVGQKVSSIGVVSTYSLVYTTTGAYMGGVLAPSGDIHFVPYKATVGQKISPNGIISTYSLVYTTSSAYCGGVLSPNGDVHFVPYYARVGQKISSSGVVSTYSLVYTRTGAYSGGVLAPNGDIHFIPNYGTAVGQKISKDGVVSTYALIKTDSVYFGGLLDSEFNINFICTNASDLDVVRVKTERINYISKTYQYPIELSTYDGFTHGIVNSDNEYHFTPSSDIGLKINLTTGIFLTYQLPIEYPGYGYSTFSSSVLSPNGDIHFIPESASVGCKVALNGVVSTYSLINVGSGKYNSGIVDLNGDIHFIPYNAQVGQKIDTNGVVTTYSLIYTTTRAYNCGILDSNGDVHFIPCSASVGQKISSSGVVSTYSLIYTTTGAYAGGIVNSYDGDCYFIPGNASVGQKISSSGVISTYSIQDWDTINNKYSFAFSKGDYIYFYSINQMAIMHKITKKVGFYKMYYNNNFESVSFFTGAAVLSNNDIISAHYFNNIPQIIPHDPNMYYQEIKNDNITKVNTYIEMGVENLRRFYMSPSGKKYSISDSKLYSFNNNIATTYSLIYTTSNAYSGGVLTQNDEIIMIPYNAKVGQKITLSSNLPFSLGICCSPFFNKY